MPFPFTSQTELATGHQVKFGVNHGSLLSSDSVLESHIAKALLSDGAGATTAVADFKSLTSTGATVNNPNTSHYLATAFDTANIQIELSTDVSHRNMALVANYVSNEDVTPNGESSNSVVINSTTTNTVTSKVLDDSSAYSNATAKFTISDPYYSNPAFSSTSYNCSFDTSNKSKFLTTRNVNTNNAHANGFGSITAGDYDEWNGNPNSSGGSYFVNGVVSIDGTTGRPSYTPYSSTNPLNLLGTGSNFEITLRTDDPNAVPLFGRYYATYTEGNASNIVIDPCGNNSLVVTTNTTDWNTFLSNINTSINTDSLPITLSSFELGSWVLPTSSVSNGFKIRIEAVESTSHLSLVGNSTYSGPLDFDLAQLSLTPKSMYILEKSMETNASIISSPTTTSIGNSTLTNPTINSTTYTNRLRIINGGLNLEQTHDVDSNYIQLLDGTEQLGSSDYNTNGSITVYDSAPVSSSTDNESVFPRASRTLVSDEYPILDNLAVQYTNDDSGYQSSVGTITGTDLTDASVTYTVSTLVGQTDTNSASGNFTDTIGYNGGAVAIVKTSNSTIDKSLVGFYSNTNSYTDGELSIIDLTCNKVWSESKVYDNTDAQIAGVTVDIKSTNMPSDFALRDIRLALEARPQSDLTLASSDTNWLINSPDAFLKSSAGKLGVIADSDIVDLLLGGNEATTQSLSILLKPSVTSVEASKFTKFHNQIEITYGSAKQITYDDEFQIVETAVAGTPDKTPLADVEITNYTSLPENTKLYKRSYTESFKVKIPFRFGNYTNLFLTTPTITHKVEYYVLTDNTNNNAELPRYFLKDVRDASGAVINAIISGVTGHTSATWETTVSFKNNDFRTHHITVQKLTSGSWADQALADNAHVDADLWYNTRSTLATDGIGTFNVSFTLSPDLITMDKEYLYVDMELEKGQTSFTLTGKRFSSQQVDALGNVNLNTFNFGSSTGTAITGTLTYSNDDDDDASPNTQAHTTLSGSGYTFKIQGNLYLSIRVIACPNGIFKCIKIGGESAGTTYHYIVTIDSQDSLDLTGSGVYGYGALRSAIRGTSTATWSLNNSAISAAYYDSNSFSTLRLTSLNQEFRPSTGKRGFKTTILRGLKPDTTTIFRTPSTFELSLAGLISDGDLYDGVYITEDIHNIAFETNANILSMYTSTSTQSQLTWNINLSYTFYKITDTINSLDTNPTVTYVPTYKAEISTRKELNILSTTLNTYSFYYEIRYTSNSTLEIYRNPDIAGADYSVNPLAYSFSPVYSFGQDLLRDSTANNLIGNIIKIFYNSSGAITDLDCQFSICPPYLKFTAIDPSANVSSLPFDSSQITPDERYLQVDNSNNIYRPFSSHPRINNISFAQKATKSYLDYVNDVSANEYMNIDNYKIAVALASGLESTNTTGSYTSFYPSTTISTSTRVTNDYVDISFSNNKLYINMDQHKLLDSFFTYSEEFAEYNLQTEIGSIFISDPNDASYNGTIDVLLEFKSGDSTSLDLYSIDTIKSGSNDTIEAVIEKYSTVAGIDNEFLNKNTPNGLAIPWNTRYTKTLSVSRNSTQALTGDRLTLDTLLTELKGQATSSNFSTWTTTTPPDSLPRLALIPNNLTGANKLKQFLTLSPKIPRSLIMLQLEDHQRLTDTFGFPKHRITFSGGVFSQHQNIVPAVIRAPAIGETYSIADQIEQGHPTLTLK